TRGPEGIPHPSPGATTDAEAWERLWAQSRLVLHTEGQVLTCSLSAPCDLLAELVPCWQPAPAGPCQPLPGLQQPAMGKGPQEFGGLRPHPNLCVQVWSSRQVRLTQCLRDREYCWGGRAGAACRSSCGGALLGLPLPPPQPPGTSPGALPGRPDDLLLLEHGTNASLCAMEWGACTPLASFTSTRAGHPGLLEQDLQRDVVAGQCWQVSVGSQRPAARDWASSDVSLCPPQLWHTENSTGVTLWACPLHKYLRARWALVWMGVLLGAACLLLLLLLKKKDVKGWLKSLRAGYGSRGE
ncbi:I17RC protein, partial [Atrichornis clamosus]|nr:I17RC protein [Atrichornis clamosus]